MHPLTLLTFRVRQLVAALLIAGTLASSAQAASITWGAPQGISSDSDVDTKGSLVGALSFGPVGGAPSTTVNGVFFNGLAMNGNPVSSGHFALSGAGAVGFISS